MEREEVKLKNGTLLKEAPVETNRMVTAIPKTPGWRSKMSRKTLL
jgi:hypothetical protein